MDKNKIILKPGLEGVPVTKSSICDINGNKGKSTFLYAKVDIKDKNSNKVAYFSELEDLNFLIKNTLKISNEESLEIIRQSIPEKNPLLYTEKSLKIL